MGGLPCYAECGGLMYLTEAIDGHEMVGFFPAKCRMTGKLKRFGYVWVDLEGVRYPAHEFHHSILEPHGNISTAFTVSKATAPETTWQCGYRKKNTIAGYPHLHFADYPELTTLLWKGKSL